VPAKSIKLNFKGMSQKQVDAMAATTLGDAIPAPKVGDFRRNAADIQGVLDMQTALDPIAERLREQEEADERQARAEATLQEWRDNDPLSSSPPWHDSSYEPSYSYSDCSSSCDSGGFDF
jgi:hypothetical protein